MSELDPGSIARMPFWQRYYVGVASVMQADDNPDTTMQVAMTEKDLALSSFGIMMVGVLFPECGKACRELGRKLVELSKAQEFLPWDDDGDLFGADDLKRSNP